MIIYNNSYILDLIERFGRYLLILLSKSTVTTIIEILVANATPELSALLMVL